jgi:hypothetical protein
MSPSASSEPDASKETKSGEFPLAGVQVKCASGRTFSGVGSGRKQPPSRQLTEARIARMAAMRNTRARFERAVPLLDSCPDSLTSPSIVTVSIASVEGTWPIRLLI